MRHSSLPDTAPEGAAAQPSSSALDGGGAGAAEPGSPASDAGNGKKAGSLSLTTEDPAPVGARTVLSVADASGPGAPRAGGLAKPRSSLRDLGRSVVGCFQWRMTRQQVGGRLGLSGLLPGLAGSSILPAQ